MSFATCKRIINNDTYHSSPIKLLDSSTLHDRTSQRLHPSPRSVQDLLLMNRPTTRGGLFDDIDQDCSTLETLDEVIRTAEQVISRPFPRRRPGTLLPPQDDVLAGATIPRASTSILPPLRSVGVSLEAQIAEGARAALPMDNGNVSNEKLVTNTPRRQASSYGSASHSHQLSPDPIDSKRVKVVDNVELGSLWHPDEEIITFLKSNLAVLTAAKDEYHPWDSIPTTREQRIHPMYREGMEEAKLPSSDPIDTSITNSPFKQEQWDERYNELVQYRRMYGNCLVPHTWKHNKPLAQWVKRQRYQYKLRLAGRRSTLTDERLKALLDLGFVWNAHDAMWEEKFEELVKYSNAHGHCNVPSIYPPNRPLSVWVRCQRRNYKIFLKLQKEGGGEGGATTTNTAPTTATSRRRPNSTLGTGNSSNNNGCSMTLERVSKLKALGFSFNPRNL